MSIESKIAEALAVFDACGLDKTLDPELDFEGLTERQIQDSKGLHPYAWRFLNSIANGAVYTDICDKMISTFILARLGYYDGAKRRPFINFDNDTMPTQEMARYIVATEHCQEYAQKGDHEFSTTKRTQTGSFIQSCQCGLERP